MTYKVPDSIHEIEGSEMYEQKLARNKRSDFGARNQFGEYDARNTLIESQTYWQCRCAVVEKELRELWAENRKRK